MPTLIEEIPILVRTALEILPGLTEIPVLGRLLTVLNKQPQNEAKYVEQLQSEFDKKKDQRKKLADDNNKYVIKVKDAIQCVETNLLNGKVALSLVKGITNTLAGKVGGAPEVLLEPILQCMLSKRLTQLNPRISSNKRRYHRPSKGHGKGRTSFNDTTQSDLTGKITQKATSAVKQRIGL